MRSFTKSAIIHPELCISRNTSYSGFIPPISSFTINANNLIKDKISKLNFIRLQNDPLSRKNDVKQLLTSDQIQALEKKIKSIQISTNFGAVLIPNVLNEILVMSGRENHFLIPSQAMNFPLKMKFYELNKKSINLYISSRTKTPNILNFQESFKNINSVLIYTIKVGEKNHSHFSAENIYLTFQSLDNCNFKVLFVFGKESRLISIINQMHKKQAYQIKLNSDSSEEINMN